MAAIWRTDAARRAPAVSVFGHPRGRGSGRSRREATRKDAFSPGCPTSGLILRGPDRQATCSPTSEVPCSSGRSRTGTPPIWPVSTFRGTLSGTRNGGRHRRRFACDARESPIANRFCGRAEHPSGPGKLRVCALFSGLCVERSAPGVRAIKLGGHCVRGTMQMRVCTPFYHVLGEKAGGDRCSHCRRIAGTPTNLPSIVLLDAVFLTGSAGFACLVCEYRGDACSRERNRF